MKLNATGPVTVALIDTGVDAGVDAGHPELQDAVWINNGEIPGDGIDNDMNGYVDDVNGLVATGEILDAYAAITE
ncbi:hypothetical protein [Clostridium transplantifaecale]|uniref:hypothetical protein n=1 Tax=Clostridium transplantifaecale TaxID=2479838 RepID=UPI00311A96C1